MKISKQAGKGHLLAGALLILLSLVSLILSFYSQSFILQVFIFFFGVWGGVECGRYLERYMLTSRREI